MANVVAAGVLGLFVQMNAPALAIVRHAPVIDDSKYTLKEACAGAESLEEMPEHWRFVYAESTSEQICIKHLNAFAKKLYVMDYDLAKDLVNTQHAPFVVAYAELDPQGAPVVYGGNANAVLPEAITLVMFDKKYFSEELKGSVVLWAGVGTPPSAELKDLYDKEMAKYEK